MLKRPTVAALFASLGTLAAGHAELALGPTPDAPLIGDLAPADDEVVTVANPILRARVAPDTARALGLDRVRWQLSRSANSFDTAVVWDSGEVDLGPSIAVTTARGTFTSADARVGLDDEIRYYWRATFKGSNGAREFPSAIHSFVMRFPVVRWDAFDDPDETPLVAHRPKLSRGLHPATWSPGEGEWRVRSGLLFPVGSAVNRAFLPAAANGVISAEVVTPADRPVHGGLHFRFYDRDYADRFVVRDNVKFVDGRDPTIDFDWSSNLAGPSLHYSLAGSPFSRYAPQPSGFIQLNRGAALPHVVQVRLNLGRIAGPSTAIVYNVRGVSASRQARGEPTVDDPATVVWAKNARDGGTLTFGSGFFPTWPGQEYGFGAVMFVDTTRAGADVALAARYRDDWTNPAVLWVRRGALRRGTPGDENADGFNESEGYYTVEADARGVVELRVDAGRVRRHRPVFRVYTGDPDARLQVWVNGVPQRDQADFLADRMDPESAVLQLLHDYASTFRLLIRFAPPD